jgi:hypothetical protein
MQPHELSHSGLVFTKVVHEVVDPGVTGLL